MPVLPGSTLAWIRAGTSSDVIIHPTDPDTFYVAAQGAQYGPGGDRGVYRTADGGQTWERVLHVNDWTGAASLSMDPKNPRILYAAMWEHPPVSVDHGVRGQRFGHL